MLPKHMVVVQARSVKRLASPGNINPVENK